MEHRTGVVLGADVNRLPDRVAVGTSSIALAILNIIVGADMGFRNRRNFQA